MPPIGGTENNQASVTTGVLFCNKRSPVTPVFPSPQKATFPNPNSIWIIVKHFIMSLWLSWWSKQSLCLTLNLHYITFTSSEVCFFFGFASVWKYLSWSLHLVPFNKSKPLKYPRLNPFERCSLKSQYHFTFWIAHDISLKRSNEKCAEQQGRFNVTTWKMKIWRDNQDVRPQSLNGH